MSRGARLRFPVAVDEELWVGRTLVPEDFFGRRAPLEIELGTGKARFLIEAARVGRAGLSNTAIVRADARLFVSGCVAPASVSAFHVYFPDPWPKKRQRKRRLLDGVFLEMLASRLTPGGLLRIATDHPGYGEELRVLIQTVPALEALPWESHPAPPATHYEIKYRAEGRPIRRFLLRRR